MKEYDFDINPKMPAVVEKEGPAEDTIPVPVDSKDPSKVLKIGSQLSPKLKK